MQTDAAGRGFDIQKADHDLLQAKGKHVTELEIGRLQSKIQNFQLLDLPKDHNRFSKWACSASLYFI